MFFISGGQRDIGEVESRAHAWAGVIFDGAMRLNRAQVGL